MHTEDARRIILRAANAGPRSPQKGNKNNPGGSQAPHIINIAGSRVSASANASSSTVAPNMNITMPTINQLHGQHNVTMPLPPLTSNGSSGSSSGHSSMSGCTAVPPISSSSSIDMAPESNSNTHLRLNPNSSSSSPSSSSTSAPSSRPLHQPNNIYFQPRPSPIPSEEHLIRKSNLRSHDGPNRQNNIHNRSEKLFQVMR